MTCNIRMLDTLDAAIACTVRALGRVVSRLGVEFVDEMQSRIPIEGVKRGPDAPPPTAVSYAMRDLHRGRRDAMVGGHRRPVSQPYRPRGGGPMSARSSSVTP